jgi:hypothetical protein
VELEPSKSPAATFEHVVFALDFDLCVPFEGLSSFGMVGAEFELKCHDLLRLLFTLRLFRQM